MTAIKNLIPDANNLMNHILRKSIYQKMPTLTNYEKIDWHNYDIMNTDKMRSGPGENCEDVKIDMLQEIPMKISMIDNGYNSIVSDQVSQNRSNPDYRGVDCITQLYYANLPKVSIILTYRNDVISIALRTITSIVNRTPTELLGEIILINAKGTILIVIYIK